MKNIFTYYLTILTPITTLFWLNKNDSIGTLSFVTMFLFYSFVFRTYVDGKRLYEKNIIQKKEIWKLVIPGKRFDYIRELYSE